MDFVGSLLHSSPADVRQMLTGILTGGVLFAALALSPMLRRAVVIAAALALIFQLWADGPHGIETAANSLLAIGRKYELFVKGILAGKLAAAALWKRQPAGSGRRQ